MAALANNTTALNISSMKDRGPLRVAADAKIYRMALLQKTVAGVVSPTPASSPGDFAGVADDAADNTDGLDGEIRVDVIPFGTWRQIPVAGSGASPEGTKVYAASDNPADLTVTASGNQEIGWLAGNQVGTTWDVHFQAKQYAPV